MTLREISLADAIAEWLKQARERGVYMEYRLEDAGDVSGGPVAPGIRAIVERVIDVAAESAPEDRWVDLSVERGPGWLVVECAASGDSPALPEEAVTRGQKILLERYEDSFRLRVEMRSA